MTVCVCSHDAGGAEVVSSYVRQQKLDCVYCLDGPALSIFERKLGKISVFPVDQVISKGNWLLCGTSWQSEIEWKAIGLARSNGIRSIAFLDHWVNYEDRFLRKGQLNLPSEIWVGDPMAQTIAMRTFPSTPVKLLNNPYFLDLREELADYKNYLGVHNRNTINILYVCEPIREHALFTYGNERYWGYTEEEAIRYFLNNLYVFEKPIGRVVIRPHPSETWDKYEWVKAEFNLSIVRGNAKSLVNEIAESDVVVGCESMALVVGLLAGKRVISCIPPLGKKISLPHPEIIQLRSLLGDSAIMP